MLEKYSKQKEKFLIFKIYQSKPNSTTFSERKWIWSSYLVVFGGQKFLSLVSDQSFNRNTPHMKNRNVATHAKIEVVFHGHLIFFIKVNKQVHIRVFLKNLKYNFLLITNKFSNQKHKTVNQKGSKSNITQSNCSLRYKYSDSRILSRIIDKANTQDAQNL